MESYDHKRFSLLLVFCAVQHSLWVHATIFLAISSLRMFERFLGFSIFIKGFVDIHVKICFHFSINSSRIAESYVKCIFNLTRNCRNKVVIPFTLTAQCSSSPWSLSWYLVCLDILIVAILAEDASVSL